MPVPQERLRVRRTADSVRRVAVLLAFAAPTGAQKWGSPPSASSPTSSPAPAVGGILTLSSTFTLDTYSYPIRVFEPSPLQASGHPVYIYITGGGMFLSDNSYQLDFGRRMAQQGFVAAMVEGNFGCATVCGAASNSLESCAQRIFSYTGAGDTTHGLVATMCRRSGVDCTLGVAVHGFSLGGLLVALAAPHSDVITASLIWGAGTFNAGSDSCCSAVSGVHTCCEPDDGTPVCLSRALWSPPKPITSSLTVKSYALE